MLVPSFHSGAPSGCLELGGIVSAVSSVQIQRILEMDRSKIIELIWFSLSDCKIMWKPSCGITGDCFVRWTGKKTIFVGRSIADELFFGVCSNCVSLWVKISEYVKTRRMRTGNFGFRDPNLGKSIWKNYTSWSKLHYTRARLVRLSKPDLMPNGKGSTSALTRCFEFSKKQIFKN